jgi:hypothetical protein
MNTDEDKIMRRIGVWSPNLSAAGCYPHGAIRHSRGPRFEYYFCPIYLGVKGAKIGFIGNWKKQTVFDARVQIQIVGSESSQLC